MSELSNRQLLEVLLDKYEESALDIPFEQWVVDYYEDQMEYYHSENQRLKMKNESLQSVIKKFRLIDSKIIVDVS